MKLTKSDFFLSFQVQIITAVHNKAQIRFSGKAKKPTGKLPARN